MIHESLGLVPLEETTKGRDLFVSLKNILEKYELPWKKFFSLTTDGARNMTGKFNGVQVFINQNLGDMRKFIKFISFTVSYTKRFCARTL